ncbi:rhomboid family intramembrane serine protease [Lysinibacillus sp. KU-BSD001]|uniref:rhomboid family intramembrane serine protease n=1 Tax=Lysinibacillus sp. KU-BSD001 TaxID=3141328 RepID=UPI0036EE528B
MFIRNENFKQYIHRYPVVSTLLTVNLAIYILTLIPKLGDEVFYFGISVNGAIMQGEWWRIITAMFLHGGFMHVLFNMFSLFLFGPELEKMAGKVRFLAIYFLSGIGGGLATLLTQDPMYATVGASGALFGIFGAFGAILYRYRHTMPELRQIMLPLIVISVILTFLQSNVNAASHIGGLATGFVLGLFFFKRKPTVVWRNRA